MAKIFSTIQFTGTESAREMAQKLMDMQRQLDNRVSVTEKDVSDLKTRVSEVETINL